jgi:peroxiredoxin
LDANGVELVTVCTDTPAQIRKGMSKHGSQAVMLADHDLALTRQYRLENTAPMLKPPGVLGLPIPTTILADAQGMVRWIDQTDDYQVRSQPDRVLGAIRSALT